MQDNERLCLRVSELLGFALLFVMMWILGGCGSTSTTSTPPPQSGLIIANIGVTSSTPSSATIIWSTNANATSQVDYGTTTAYGQSSALGTTLSTSHSITIYGLSSGTTYNYRVKSRDAAGNLSTSSNFTFTTNAATPPVISGVNAVASSSSATIT